MLCVCTVKDMYLDVGQMLLADAIKKIDDFRFAVTREED